MFNSSSMMMWRLLPALISLLLHLITTTAGDAVNCPTQWKPWKDKCVQVYNSEYESWIKSRSNCISDGGKLIEFNTVGQNYTDSEISQLITQNNMSSQIWVGARKQKSWFWSDNGTTNSGNLPITEQYWGQGEPNQNAGSKEDRISLYKELNPSYSWNDESHHRKDANSPYKALCYCSNCGPPKQDITHLFNLRGHDYFISERHQKIDWNQAWSDCKSHNAKLVKIETKELQLKLQTELSKHGDYHYWTAGYWDQQKPKFLWNNGEAVVSVAPVSIYSASDEMCLTFYFMSNTLYKPMSCTNLLQSICELESRPTTTNTASTMKTASTMSTTTSTTQTTQTTLTNFPSSAITRSSFQSSSFLTGSTTQLTGGCLPFLTSWVDKCVIRYKSATWSGAQKVCAEHYSGRLIELNRKQYHSRDIIGLLDKTRPVWVGARREISWYWSFNSPLQGSLIVGPHLPIGRKFWAKNQISVGGDDLRIILDGTKNFTWLKVTPNTNITTNLRIIPLCQCENCITAHSPRTVTWHTKYEQTEYFIPSVDGVDWTTAWDRCKGVTGAQLVGLISDKLQEYLQQNLPAGYHYWTAGFSNQIYRWEDGGELENVRMPQLASQDEDICVTARREGLNITFTSDICQSKHGFICVYKPSTLPTTTQTTTTSKTPSTTPTSTTTTPTTTTTTTTPTTTILSATSSTTTTQTRLPSTSLSTITTVKTTTRQFMTSTTSMRMSRTVTENIDNSFFSSTIGIAVTAALSLLLLLLITGFILFALCIRRERKEENKVVPDRTRRLSHWEQTSTVNKYTQRTSMSGDISLAPVPVHQEFQW